MILVYDTFICKPGQASKFVKKMKEAMADFSEMKYFLTDAVGQFNKVVMIAEYKSLSDYEKSFDRYKNQSEDVKKMMQAMEGYQDMYLTGSREIYQVW